MEVSVTMPDLSTTGEDVTIVRWYVAPGDRVVRGQPLLEVETDKATMDVESVASGTLVAQMVQANDNVAAGAVLALVESESAAPSPAPAIGGGNGSAVEPATPDGDDDLTQSLLRSVQKVCSPAAPNGDAPPASRNGGGWLARNRHSVADSERPDSRRPATNPAAHDRTLLLRLYADMVRIREFEEGVKFLFLQGSMPGTIHQCQGQEATAVGVCAALQADDFITSTFRGHGHALAKGLSMAELVFELYGAVTGCCRGKGGSMHVGNFAKGMIPAIAIVGGGIPLAAGMGLAFKMKQTRQVVACFFGDGATSEGAFHEGVSLAAIWNLPVVFVCENNLYGASTRVDKITRLEKLSDHAAAYGIRGETVDGNDVLSVYAAAQQAVAGCRAGSGPVLLELLTYRRTGHSRRDPCHYQPDQEKKSWFERDPIEVFAQALAEQAGVDRAELEAIRAAAVEEFEAAVKAAPAQAMPTEQDLLSDVFA